MKKGILPPFKTPTRKTFDASYIRISNSDWKTYGGEMAIWLAGVKYARNQIKAELLKQERIKRMKEISKQSKS